MTNDRPTVPTFVAYFRVSTERQGQSGLGLEAQRQSVTTFVSQAGGQVISDFVEIESGKRRDRPELIAALALCRKTKATLLIAKLDRLARSVHFISGLMEAGVDFVAVDNPHANRLMLHLLAAFAEHEREMISLRTKSALAAARARGVTLGKNGQVLAARFRAEANDRAQCMAPIINELRAAGVETLQGLAAGLNSRGICGHNGGAWHPTSVRRLLVRMNSTCVK